MWQNRDMYVNIETSSVVRNGNLRFASFKLFTDPTQLKHNVCL